MIFHNWPLKHRLFSVQEASISFLKLHKHTLLFIKHTQNTYIRLDEHMWYMFCETTRAPLVKVSLNTCAPQQTPTFLYRTPAFLQPLSLLFYHLNIFRFGGPQDPERRDRGPGEGSDCNLSQIFVVALKTCIYCDSLVASNSTSLPDMGLTVFS